MKIQIIGYAGSGKSTLAMTLSEIANIPVLHLDNTHFYGDWQERDAEEQSTIVRAFMADNDSWLMDGNYTSVATERFAMSDVTVFLDFNRWVCFFSAYRRSRKFRGKIRPDLPCAEKFDRSFRRWILIDSRKKDFREKLLGNLNATSGERVILKNRSQARKFVQEFASKYSKECY